MDFKGTATTPVLTMFAYAPRSDLNHSNNLTVLEYPGLISGSEGVKTGSNSYVEDPFLRYKNTVSSSYPKYEDPFKKQTYISSIGIYDKYRNLIAVAKLATPLRKREEDEFIFKLKLDM